MFSKNKNDLKYGAILTESSIELYWSIYKGLEKELIDLSNVIHIDDDQKNVYSMRIAELILRSAIGIESLAKDIYATRGFERPHGCRFNFDDPCMVKFNEIWDIEQKVVRIKHPFIRFSDVEIYPFKNITVKTSNREHSNIWKCAYNDIKHNLMNNMKSANIYAFIEALAAFYILNVYAKGILSNIEIENRSAAIGFDLSFNSEVFCVSIQRALDAKSVSARGIEYPKFEYDPSVIYQIQPDKKSLERIYDVMKTAFDERSTKSVLTEAISGLLAAKEISLPEKGGLSSKDLEKISFKAQEVALGKHTAQLGNVVADMHYIATLNEKPK